MKYIPQITLLVTNYDEAIHFYTEKLGFALIEDTKLTETKRWVLIAPEKESEFRLLLAQAKSEQEQQAVGNQTGGRVFGFLFTDDFKRDFSNMTKNGVEFPREPVQQPYGMVAVFKDLYGNLWDLLEPKVNL
jgi:catechol 2,3-dioxygenase-like lactoylglutathione lyase family enzyme